MPSAPRSRVDVVDVLLAHQPVAILDADPSPVLRCSCAPTDRAFYRLEHADHVADALAAAATPTARPVTPANLRVLVLLAEARGVGLTDTQLARRWAVKVARPLCSWPLISESGIRTRRSELVSWGLAEEVPDTRGRTLSNRPTRLWRLSDGKAAALPRFDADTLAALEQLGYEAGVDVVTHAALALALQSQVAAS